MPAETIDEAVRLQRKYYADTAARYQEMHEHEGSGDPAHMEFVVSLLQMLRVQTLLDVGTASGRALRTLKTAIPALTVCGIEPVGALLDDAVVRGNTAFGAVIQASGDALPFADSSFDAVCEFAILHHVAEPAKVVAEMLRVAGRAVIISDSNRFGQGPMWLRFIKLALYKTKLWGLFNYLKTSGKGYLVTEGDGIAYSYSVYDSFDQIAGWADRIILFPSDNTKPRSWLHPLLTSGHIILCAIRERPR
jgi:ubiquinone/menaquinone biosynthesis C-methylase UbiE